MRNANKSKVPYSAMVREVEKRSESISGTGAPSKVDQFFRLIGSIITPSFNEIGSLLFQ